METLTRTNSSCLEYQENLAFIIIFSSSLWRCSILLNDCDFRLSCQPELHGRSSVADMRENYCPSLSPALSLWNLSEGTETAIKVHVMSKLGLCESGAVFRQDGSLSNPGADFPLVLHRVGHQTKMQICSVRCRSAPAVKCLMNTRSYSSTGSQVRVEPSVPSSVPNNQWKRTHTDGRPGEEEQARLWALRLISVWAKQNLCCWFYLSF